jgi:hypothetical protein
MFLDSVLVRGVEGALALLSPSTKAKYKAHLKSHACLWWQPGLLWEQWPKICKKLI